MKREQVLEELESLPRTGLDDFITYYQRLYRIDDKWNYHGLSRPFTRVDYIGVFPVQWIAAFGHYTVEEIRSFVDGVVLKTMVISGFECVFRLLPIGKLGQKIEKELDKLHRQRGHRTNPYLP